MLILTRKQDESIIINDEIEIKILEIDGNRVQLGIEAPKSVPIHRQEVYEDIQKENKMAASSNNNFPADLLDLLKKGVKKGEDKEK
ncbi:carbon storage regulator CsrA [Orenia marismortui]|uniref:carbon storage regulator CsrA n=1 Tax=Orenia marismortui TaxID=46469 RepID=UPI000363E4AB|nr:carbon storage regulator CsrA [Orenia marismortui]